VRRGFSLTTTDRLSAADAGRTTRVLLDLWRAHVSTFVQRFTNVVAEETYVQDWKTNAGSCWCTAS
jgi:hypothetical protein